eukprot:4013038-Alexandrium_andersonii.AAC.1
MSASLVGSEMCIRDSLRRYTLGAGRKSCPGAADVRAVCRPATAIQQQPVSYTHLTLPTICSV